MDKRTILIVEDEGVVAMEIQNRLLALGYEVAGRVATGEDAIASLEECEPDLVLMDIRLKGPMDGIETAERIQAMRPVPVVFLTAFDDEETLRRAKRTDLFGYILKPFSERDLRTSIDIALYKHRIDAALREREQWLATTLSGIGDAVLATDTDGTVTYLNPVAEELTGWTMEDADGRHLSEVLALEDAASHEPTEIALHRALEQGEPVALDRDLVLVNPQGARIPISDSGSPMTLARLGGNDVDVLGTVLVFRDISPKKAAEAQVRELNRSLHAANTELADQKGFLDALFESVPSPVVVVGQDRRIAMANRRFRETFGIADESALALPLGEVLGCPDAIATSGACGTLPDCISCGVNNPVMTALEGGVSGRQRCAFRRQVDGHTVRMVFLNHTAPLDYAGSRHAILILEDITELTGLRQLLSPERSFAGIVGNTPQMREVFETIREVADLKVPVMILGESGTGKELVARAIHDHGRHSAGSFVAVNCGALPDGLLESELFGHVKGAFTGAIRDRKGRFELADGGTIFLDEIGDLSPPMQVKLLRVLQEGTFERVGSERTLTSNARVICATNRDLEQEVAAGRFREDLFYRLCVMPIRLPPLRDRLEDVPLIAEYLVEKESATAGGRQVALSPEVVNRFMSHEWPGNIRELQNALTHAFIKCKTHTIEVEHLPPGLAGVRPRTPVEIGNRSGLTPASVAEALAKTGGNKLEAAKELGVSRATLYRFFDRYPHLRDTP